MEEISRGFKKMNPPNKRSQHNGAEQKQENVENGEAHLLQSVGAALLRHHGLCGDLPFQPFFFLRAGQAPGRVFARHQLLFPIGVLTLLFASNRSDSVALRGGSG